MTWYRARTESINIIIQKPLELMSYNRIKGYDFTLLTMMQKGEGDAYEVVQASARIHCY